MALVALGLAFVIVQFPLHYLEAWTYDWRSRLKTPAPTSGLIELIMIRPDTLTQLGREDRLQDHQLLLEGLEAGQPRAIVYSFDPSELRHSPEEAEAFGELTERMQTPIYFASFSSPAKGQGRLPPLPSPFDFIEPLPAPIGSDITLFARDGVSRRFIYSIDDQPTLHRALAKELGAERPRGLFSVLDVIQGYIAFRPAGTYPSTEFLDARDGNPESLNRWADKVVIIGDDSLRSSRFYLSTPLSRDITALTLAEAHANALDTLILDQAPRRSPKGLNFLTIALVAWLTLALLFFAPPARGLLLLGGVIATFILLAAAVFSAFGFWLPMAQPLLAVFVCYYFFVPYRLIVENRRSWEYYQRNQLLTQVEELKSNFMRMMSHDLKTPLARIQGMAELVLKERQPLSPEQKTAVESISHSSEELAEFIGSILNLTRIESKEVKLQLRSRDINSLIQDVVKKCEYLAQQKNIRILQELEPMFSMKMDEDLIRQVLTNLLENAIKYSPPETQIQIRSQEVDGRALIQITDQGYGIAAEDLPNIFTKFYRSRQASSTSIKGSGLGLFLAKYFVDLHQGRITVESQLEKGSTFCIELPMNLTESPRAQEEQI